MECKKLPTKPGPYWWREKDGDEWELGWVSCPWGRDLVWETIKLATQQDYQIVSDMGGQWKRIHNPDEGQESTGVVDPSGIVVMAAKSEEKCICECSYLNDNDHTLSEDQFYTNKPVTIYPKDEECN